MDYEGLIHEMILEHMRKQLSKDYREIRINPRDEKKVEYKGHYPDMILGNHGMVLSILEVETEGSVSEKAVQRWRELSGLGVKLVIMVPKEAKVKATDLIWNKGLMGKVSLGMYEIVIRMP
ncbi:MAG: hypothetical protein ACMUIS_11750 [bacterium]